MKSDKGFSMIELMVVVAVVGILMVFAMPAYTNYMTRGRIPDATSNLATKRMAMEQFFLDNHTYVGSDGTGQPCADDNASSKADDNASSKYFTFKCNGTPSSTAYIITATGNNPGPMAGFTYTIDQRNTKTSVIDPPVNCNSTYPPSICAFKSSNTSCWITNTGGIC